MAGSSQGSAGGRMRESRSDKGNSVAPLDRPAIWATRATSAARGRPQSVSLPRRGPLTGAHHLATLLRHEEGMAYTGGPMRASDH